VLIVGDDEREHREKWQNDGRDAEISDVWRQKTARDKRGTSGMGLSNRLPRHLCIRRMLWTGITRKKTENIFGGGIGEIRKKGLKGNADCCMKCCSTIVSNYQAN